MEYRIEFAPPEAEAELRGIFLESDMDLAGEISEHVVIARDNEILGGALLTRTDTERFHLSVLAVRDEARGLGIGKRLLAELTSRPWAYALNAANCDGLPARYTVTTAAKGESAAFYRRHGFIDCDFTDLADPFSGQCDECPDREGCRPVPMQYHGSATSEELP